MMHKDNAVERIEYEGREICIFHDDCGETPRVWDNLGKMICFHRKYSLGDKHDVCSEDYEDWDDLEQALIKEFNPCVILPLYLYDHSGLTINTTGFSCPWDSMRVGFILATKEQVRSEWGKKRISPKLRQKVRDILIGEVDTYDMYLTGQVYGYMILDTDDDLTGGCWGYYGSDFEESGLLENARGEIDYMVEQERQKALKKERETWENVGHFFKMNSPGPYPVGSKVVAVINDEEATTILGDIEEEHYDEGYMYRIKEEFSRGKPDTHRHDDGSLWVNDFEIQHRL